MKSLAKSFSKRVTWNESTKSIPMFPDDTIGTAMQKICDGFPGLASGPDDLYVWARAPVSPPAASHASSFALNLFRGRRFVHRSEASQAFAFLSGLRLATPRGRDMLSLVDAVASVPKSWAYIYEPASVKQFDRGYPYYLPIDPKQLTIEHVRGFPALHVVSNARATLESICNASPDTELFVTSRDAVVEHMTAKLRMPPASVDRVLQLYFGGPINSGRQNDAFVQQVLYTDSSEKFQAESSLLKWSLTLNEHSIAPAIQLPRVMNKLALSGALPYAFLRDPAHSPLGVHRVYRRAFSLSGSIQGTLSVGTLQSYMSDARSKAPLDAAVLIVYGRNFAVQLSARQACQVHFWFDASQAVQRDRVAGEYLEAVNACVRALHDAGATSLSPIDAAFLSGLEPGQLFSAKYGAVLSSHRKTPSLEHLSNVCRSRFAPVFFVVPHRKGSTGKVLTLQYKRYDDYDEMDAMRLFIHRLSSQGVEDDASKWVDIVRAAFDCDESTAREAIDEWRTSGELLKFGRTVAQYQQGVFVNVRTLSDVGVSYTVHGVTSWSQADRIDRAMRHLLAFSSHRGAQPAAAAAAAEQGADMELLEALRKDMSEATPPPGADEGGRKDGGFGYVLKSLKRADAELFKSGSYALICSATARRQPVVMSRSELDASDAQFPGAAADAVQTGSTPELARKNYYICPHAWCPKSRIALSKAQFESLGRRCPVPGVDETPIVMDSPYFQGQPRRARLLDASKHPDGYAMPCCFKQGKDADDDQRNDYIQNNKVPAPIHKYAVLPPALSAMLASGPCGSKPDGSGLLTVHSRDCCVRMGLPPSPQPFLACAAHFAKRSVRGLVDDMVARLDMPTFLSLGVCRTFVDLHSTDVSFKAFAQWFASQRAYVAKFALESVVAKLGNVNDDDVHREFVWYSAMQAYVAYLRDDGIVKTPLMALELVQKVVPVIVVDVREDDTVTLPCQTLPVAAQTVHVVVRYGPVFEPVLRVSPKQSAPEEGHSLPAVAAAQAKYCQGDGQVSPNLALASLRKKHGNVRIDQVIDARLRLVGFYVHPQKTLVRVLPTAFDPRLPGKIVYAKTVERRPSLEERIVTGKAVPDPRTEWMARLDAQRAAEEAASRAVRDAIERSSEAQDRLYFLRHPMNPLSEHMRAEALRSVLASRVPVSKLKDATVRRLLLQASEDDDQDWWLASSKPAASLDTVLLTDQDVAHRAAKDLFALLRTPYTSMDIDLPRVLKDVTHRALAIPITRGSELPPKHFVPVERGRYEFASREALAVLVSAAVGAMHPGVTLPTNRAISVQQATDVARLFGIEVVASERAARHGPSLVLWLDRGGRAAGVQTTPAKDRIIWQGAEG